MDFFRPPNKRRKYYQWCIFQIPGSDHSYDRYVDCTARINVKWIGDINILRSFKSFDILNLSNWSVCQTANPAECDHICDRTVSLKQQHSDKIFDMTKNSYE